MVFCPYISLISTCFIVVVKLLQHTKSTLYIRKAHLRN